MSKKYRKKPVVIEAMPFYDNIEQIEALSSFINNQDVVISYKQPNNPKLLLETLEGTMEASIGDYIIKGVQGEYYPCKPDIFKQTYDEV